MAKTIQEYLSPQHKVIDFLRSGRDKLRLKYSKVRVDLRRAENQVRAVTKSRENWQKRAKAAEAELRALKKRAAA